MQWNIWEWNLRKYDLMKHFFCYWRFSEFYKHFENILKVMYIKSVCIEKWSFNFKSLIIRTEIFNLWSGLFTTAIIVVSFPHYWSISKQTIFFISSMQSSVSLAIYSYWFEIIIIDKKLYCKIISCKHFIGVQNSRIHLFRTV